MVTLSCADLGCGLWAKCIAGPCYCYMVHGHSFNPPMCSDFQTAFTSGSNAGVVGSATCFDLSNFWAGHEVATAFSHANGSTSGACLRERWYDATGLLFDYMFSFSLPGGGDSWMFSYIGIKNAWDGREITLVGNYCVCHELCEPGCVVASCLIGFCTCLMPACHQYKYATGSPAPGYCAHEGFMWVDGEYMWFMNASGNKVPILHDGSTYGVGSCPGMVWLPDTAGAKYLMYIDCSCTIRRTHNADSIGWCGCDGQPSSPGTSYAGFTWGVGYSGFNQHTFMFINCDGQLLRMGNGYVFGNEY